MCMYTDGTASGITLPNSGTNDAFLAKYNFTV